MGNTSLTDEITFRGGLQAGWQYTAYPFAGLSCSRERLRLRAMGTFEFRPQDVVAIRPARLILGQGLAIEHNRLDYPSSVVFNCAGSQMRIVDGLRQVGFVPCGRAVVRPRGMPLRWSWSAACVLVLFLCFQVDQASRADGQAGLATLAALACLLGFATSIRVFARMQRIVLAPGHSLLTARSLLTSLQLVSGVMTLVLAILLLGVR